MCIDFIFQEKPYKLLLANVKTSLTTQTLFPMKLLTPKTWTALSALILSTTVTAQTYCTAGGDNPCRNDIQNVTLQGENSNINNSSNCEGYGNFLNQSVYVIPGNNYQGSTVSNPTGFFFGQITIWVDFNLDGDFLDQNEMVFTSSTSQAGAGAPIPFTLTVPQGATLGNSRMRVKTESTAGTYPPCGNSAIGETEDYTIIITNSPPNPNGYCSAAGGCHTYNPTGRHIDKVVIGSIDNSSGCGGGSYTDYTNLSTTIASGGSANISVETSASNPADVVTVFVDWNQDFDFADANEAITLQGNAGLYTGAVAAPTNAAVGTTRMRIAFYWSGNGTYNGCGTRARGEVEDYALNVTGPAPNCATSMAPADAATGICPDQVLTWDADPLGGGPSGYKVYFGTAATPPLVSTQTTKTYNPGSLAPNTKYYWKIVPYNGTGDATGCATRSFTTSTLGSGISPRPAVTCAGQPLVLNGNPTGGTAPLTHTWTGSGASKLNTNDAAQVTFTHSTPASFDLTYSVTDDAGCTAKDTITVVVATPVTVDVSIAQTQGTNPTCSGANVEFTATPTNGGSSPTYTWRVNGNTVGTNSPTYSSTSLNDGDQVDVLLASSEACASPASKQSNVISMQVTSNLQPDVTIGIVQGTNPSCDGESVEYRATPTNGGSAPTYVWRVNGTPTGTTGDSFSTATLQDGDVVDVEMTSSSSCAANPVVLSAPTTHNVLVAGMPDVSIAITTGSNPSCANELIEFTPTATFGGNAPQFEWLLNGQPQGVAPTFASASFADGDNVQCVMVSNYQCRTADWDSSDVTALSIVSDITPTIDVAFSAGSEEICEGELVTLDATVTNEGSNPTYEWFLNGISSGNGPQYSSPALMNGDQLYCELTSSNSCASQPTVQSPTINMTVHAIPAQPTITLNVDVLTSSAATGNQWMMNGSDLAGEVNQTYTVTQDGTYSVRVIDNGCESPVSEDMVIQGLGIEGLNAINFSVAPNPSSGVFTVTMEQAQEANFKVYDMKGSLVYQTSNSAATTAINIKDQPNGVYVLRIETAGQTQTVRVLKGH